MLPDDTDERHAFDSIIEEFSDGIINADIVVRAPDVSDGVVQRAIEDLTVSLAADDFFGRAESTVSANGDLVHISVSIAGDVSSDESIAGVLRPRDDYIPEAFADVSAEVLVGGDTARSHRLCRGRVAVRAPDHGRGARGKLPPAARCLPLDRRAAQGRW